MREGRCISVSRKPLLHTVLDARDHYDVIIIVSDNRDTDRGNFQRT